MPKSRTKEEWELAAEELARLVRNLLDDHGNAIDKALRKSMGKDEARDVVRQIEQQLDVLTIELWRRTTPRRTVGFAASLVLGAALGQLVDLGTTDLYEAVMGARGQADHVVECVLEADEVVIDAGDGSSEDVIDAGDGEVIEMVGDAYIQRPRRPGDLLRDQGED